MPAQKVQSISDENGWASVHSKPIEKNCKKEWTEKDKNIYERRGKIGEIPDRITEFKFA